MKPSRRTHHRLACTALAAGLCLLAVAPAAAPLWTAAGGAEPPTGIAETRRRVRAVRAARADKSDAGDRFDRMLAAVAAGLGVDTPSEVGPMLDLAAAARAEERATGRPNPGVDRALDLLDARLDELEAPSLAPPWLSFLPYAAACLLATGAIAALSLARRMAGELRLVGALVGLEDVPERDGSTRDAVRDVLYAERMRTLRPRAENPVPRGENPAPRTSPPTGQPEPARPAVAPPIQEPIIAIPSVLFHPPASPAEGVEKDS